MSKKPPPEEPSAIDPNDPTSANRAMLKCIENNDQAGALNILRAVVGPDPEPAPKLRSMISEFKLPVETIDGQAVIGQEITLRLRQENPEMVEIVMIDGTTASIRLAHLGAAGAAFAAIHQQLMYATAPRFPSAVVGTMGPRRIP